MSTTKLTRKEMVAEDPVHVIIARLFTYCRENLAKISLLVLALIVVALGIYAGSWYLGNRAMQAQDQLAKGIELFNATITPDATDNPYSKGPMPTFRSDNAKYQAAAKAFSSILSGFSFGSATDVARYYLGLSQLQLGQKQEAIKNLESVANGSKNHTVGYLSKKVIASIYFNSGNYKSAQEMLESMIKDSQCDLPKEELSIQLSRVLVAQGKTAEAIKVLHEADKQSAAFGAFKQQLVAELDKIQKTSAGTEQKILKP